MEKYTYGSGNSADAPVKLGKFFSLVHEKHIDAYGETGADNIVENIVETYKQIHVQLKSDQKNNNVLLVGKVQSGKTAKLIIAFLLLSIRIAWVSSVFLVSI